MVDSKVSKKSVVKRVEVLLNFSIAKREARPKFVMKVL